MAKVDKSQYSKAQWKIVQAERRRQKELDRKLKAQKKLEKQKGTERTVKVSGTNRKRTSETISRATEIFKISFKTYRNFITRVVYN